MDLMQNNKIRTGLLIKCLITEYKSVMEELNIERIKWWTNHFKIQYITYTDKRQLTPPTKKWRHIIRQIKRTHNFTPAMYNNSHIYFNYRQIPFTLFFLNQLHVFILYAIHTFTFPECIHLNWWGGRGDCSIKWFKTKRGMSRISYETHVKYCSSQALLSSGTVLKSAHGLFNIWQLCII